MIQIFSAEAGVLVAGAVSIVGLSLLAAGLAVASATVYRWYAGTRIPAGLAALAGLTAVAVYLNTTAALGQVIGNQRGVLELEVALVNGATFAGAAVGTLAGREVGDRAASALAIGSRADDLDAEVSRIVRTVGRVIVVTLPEEIEDIEGYDPVTEETKAAITGRTLTFPRRLTVAELRDRLIARLKEDYGVGHVGIDLEPNGNVEYLALGSRASGIGPTLAPGTGAVAVRADPPFSTTTGDAVQVRADGEQVTTAEVRAAVGDIVTLVLDEAEAQTLSPDVRYRLVTMSVESRPDREFASLLRSADETMGVVAVDETSTLVGSQIGSLDPTVVAVRPTDGPIEAIPSRERALAVGDTVYAIARPEALRRLETAAG